MEPYCDKPVTGVAKSIYSAAIEGETDLRYAAERLKGKQDFFSHKLTYKNQVPLTITGEDKVIIWGESRYRNFHEVMRCGSFPMDYDFQGSKPEYLIGMSVPPVMTAQIATRIYEQWLTKLK